MGHARAAVNVQQNAVDVRFARVDVRSQLGPEDSGLSGQQVGDIVDAELLPAAHGCVAGAAHQRGDGASGLWILRARQDHPCQHPQTGSVRRDLHRGQQLVDHAGAAHLVAKKDVRAGMGRDRQALATLSGECVALDPLVRKDPKTGICAGRLPTGFRSLEAFIPGRLPARTASSEDQCGQQQSGADQSQRGAWHKFNTGRPGTTST
jgi:hypothetical protein